MNGSLKEATVWRYDYDAYCQFEERLASFTDAYNFAKRLRTLRRLTSYGMICRA